MNLIDTGTRCDRHVGEAFPPRCYDCQHLTATSSRASAILAAHHWDCDAGVHKVDVDGWCVLCGAEAGS